MPEEFVAGLNAFYGEDFMDERLDAKDLVLIAFYSNGSNIGNGKGPVAKRLRKLIGRGAHETRIKRLVDLGHLQYSEHHETYFPATPKAVFES